MSRREALRNYFLAVVNDLNRRGLLRKQQGQSLEQILRAEAPLLIQEIRADFTAVATEIGMGVLGGLQIAAANGVNNLVGVGVQKLSEILSGVGKRR